VPDPGGAGDRIELRGLRFFGCHGALPAEVELPQPFEVDIDLFTSTRAAGLADDLSLTIDYAPVCEAVRAVVEGPPARLLERLAERLAERVLAAASPGAQAVTVAVRKMRPPVPYHLASAGVRVHRKASLNGKGGAVAGQ